MNLPRTCLMCRIVLMAALAAVGGCTSPPQSTSVPAPLPEAVPAAHYRQLEAQGGKVLAVQPGHSLVTVEVGRAGSLARLGHDHVVASHDVAGWVAPEEGRADLYVPLERLAVDEPELRARAGFDTQPSAAAIDGTRRNMLDKVLEAERFPFAFIQVRRDGGTLKVAITLHGTTRDFAVPAQFEELPDGIAVSGQLSFAQSDFGIVPMSVLGGALQVRDRLDLRFRVVAAACRTG